jgi:5-methylcytosine-specific restriction endonuclease McrA
MSRKEFSNPTMRAAYDRSGGVCEATGDIYGLPEGQRCATPLTLGVEYDHIDPDANSKDNSLENCCAACPKCHRWKTSNRDAPLIAKTNHQQDMARNIKQPSRGFRSPSPGYKYSWKSGRMERA